MAKSKKHRVKKKCDKCGLMRNELNYHNGKFICGKCKKTGRTIK